MDVVRRVIEELDSKIESAFRIIEEQEAQIAVLRSASVADITQSIYEAKKHFGLKWNHGCYLNITKDDIRVSFYAKYGNKYDDIVQMDNANLSYSGNSISAEVRLTPVNITRINIELYADVPPQDIETLRACGKIVTSTTTNTSSVC